MPSIHRRAFISSAFHMVQAKSGTYQEFDLYPYPLPPGQGGDAS